jgi:hypothetical protein
LTSTLSMVPINAKILQSAVADPRGGGGKGGANEPPFGLHLTLRNTDDSLNGTPLSGYRTKETAAMAHLRMLQKKIGLKTDRSAGSLSKKKPIENGRGFVPKWAWLQKFRTQECTRTPLLEILDPPLIRCRRSI